MVLFQKEPADIFIGVNYVDGHLHRSLYPPDYLIIRLRIHDAGVLKRVGSCEQVVGSRL
jgi:hypothetical protein